MCVSIMYDTIMMIYSIPWPFYDAYTFVITIPVVPANWWCRYITLFWLLVFIDIDTCYWLLYWYYSDDDTSYSQPAYWKPQLACQPHQAPPPLAPAVQPHSQPQPGWPAQPAASQPSAGIQPRSQLLYSQPVASLQPATAAAAYSSSQHAAAACSQQQLAAALLLIY